MQGKSVKLTIIKSIYAVLIFVIAVLIISRVSTGDKADMTAHMPEATLPTVTFISNFKEINPLHGYLEEMDISHIRGTVFPIGSGRDINYKINTYGQKVSNLSFEVRNIDGSGLVENTVLQDYMETSDTITGTFQLKDLITSGSEYMLVMLMDTESGKARFYTRIVWTNDDFRYHLDDEVDFVRNFSLATFDKEAATEYSRYL